MFQIKAARVLLFAVVLGNQLLARRRFETDEDYADFVSDDWYSDGHSDNGWALHRAEMRRWSFVQPQSCWEG